MSRSPFAVARHFWRNSRGGTAIEFAMVAPIFLFCVFAFVQLGFGIYAQSTISQLAEKGARHLLFASTDVDGATETILAGMTATPLDPMKLTISALRLAQPYPHVELTLDYAFKPPGMPLPEDINLRSVVLIPVSP
ncbi:MAG: pilus assembly protein [Devosia sp.]|jgi:Flp pilus assembly protein TadG|uniref:TadE/TadG family type IV pilus assembly protein n=1 Tax=unclassified Devosia TaxID=196773 RepID=UPI0019F2D34A|nr:MULTISPECIES: TadE/TadG family type IV pilus assembly protein [unclassified Devosia]MBF0679554.1 pilus assembly protein [Devosia sp.]WEJ33816.1 pilus assembly protein [Devosia sp. SD17-2]